jgi:GT2 family glycosyltransferase
MISIITAVHNGLPFNKLFLESIRRYTHHPCEVIIIDNASTDGSREYFEKEGCVVIANGDNYNYPYTQNQGIRAAKGDHLFFLNNDIILSPGWDKALIDIAAQHGLDVLSAAGIENLGDPKSTQSIRRKWKRTKNPLMVLGIRRPVLQLMLRLMYGSWTAFCNRRRERFGTQVVEGIVGNNVLMTRKALALLGEWDERIQHADFDLFIRAKKRAEEQGDIRPCHIALGVYIHHFIRMTQKYGGKPKPFANAKDIIFLHDKYGEEELDRLHPDNATIRKK